MELSLALTISKHRLYLCSVGVQGKDRGGQNKWDRVETPAIEAKGRKLMVRGCDFQENMPQILLEGKLSKAVITDNMIRGPERIENRTGQEKDVVIRDNVAD